MLQDGLENELRPRTFDILIHSSAWIDLRWILYNNITTLTSHSNAADAAVTGIVRPIAADTHPVLACNMNLQVPSFTEPHDGTPAIQRLVSALRSGDKDLVISGQRVSDVVACFLLLCPIDDASFIRVDVSSLEPVHFEDRGTTVQLPWIPTQGVSGFLAQLRGVGWIAPIGSSPVWGPPTMPSDLGHHDSACRPCSGAQAITHLNPQPHPSIPQSSLSQRPFCGPLPSSIAVGACSTGL